MKKEKNIVVKPIQLNTVTIKIVGDGDLILNKMNDVTTRELTDKQKNKSKTVEEKNEWEQIITAIHWRDGKPTEFTEESLKDALKNNAPCITAFGLKKSFEEAIVRNKMGKRIKYEIMLRPSQLKKLSKSGQYRAKKREHKKSSIRVKVEHVFGVVKGQLRYRKTRYRGLRKQISKCNIMFALANLILADRPCLAV